MGNKYPMFMMLGVVIGFGLAASPTFARNVVGAESSAEAEGKNISTEKAVRSEVET